MRDNGGQPGFRISERFRIDAPSPQKGILNDVLSIRASAQETIRQLQQARPLLFEKSRP
jgi:hypothetical protein